MDWEKSDKRKALTKQFIEQRITGSSGIIGKFPKKLIKWDTRQVRTFRGTRTVLFAILECGHTKTFSRLPTQDSGPFQCNECEREFDAKSKQ